MSSFLQNNHNNDNVGDKFRQILAEDARQKNVNLIYQLKSKWNSTQNIQDNSDQLTNWKICNTVSGE